MFPCTQLLFIYSLIAITFASKYLDEPCDRIRRPLHLLTNEEKILFVEGYQRLRENKKLTIISQTHAFSTHSGVHHGSNFFFWHEYLLWEIETQIRALGPEFECFALPYWDFTVDSGKNNDDKFIFSESLLGGDGDIDNDLCVKPQSKNSDENLWSVDRYSVPVEDLCMEDEQAPECCLKRKTSDVLILPTAAELAMVIAKDQNFLQMSNKFAYYHGVLHSFFGSDDHAAMKGEHSTDDPIFFVLHSFAMLIRLVWTSCNNFDNINIDDPPFDDNKIVFDPFCATPPYAEPNTWNCGAIKWDDTFDYYPMDDMELDWLLVSQDFKLKLKQMYNPSDWGIKYELGNFLKNTHLDKWCKNINNEWFIQSDINDLARLGDKHKTDVQKYIDFLWNEKSNPDTLPTNIIDMFEIVDEYSCKYNRKYAPNSCWDEDIFTNIETCNDRIVSDKKKLSLQYLLDFDGVKDNECLKQIRIDTYHLGYFLGDHTGLMICNGEFDYKCNEYDNNEYKQQFQQIINKELVNNDNINLLRKKQYNNNVNGALLQILFAIIVIISVLCCLYNYYFKKDDNYQSKLKLITNTDTLYSTF